eukprot:4699030-Pyramimonas_sp.AAC.1
MYSEEELNAMEKSLVLRGAFHPHAGAPLIPMDTITVNLTALSLAPRLEPDDRKQMLYTVFACNPSTHSQFHRHVTLTNLLNVPLTFHVVCKRPFMVAGVEPSVPQLAPPYPKPVHTVYGFAKQIYTLPPREAVEVALDFVTPEQVLEADPDATEDLTFKSNLVCIFRPAYPNLEPNFTQVRPRLGGGGPTRRSISRWLGRFRVGSVDSALARSIP